ncbi:insulin receptor substrate 1 isoform X6 [Anopheles gambiae]|uniref:insulin receptor substrate 1 isoform X6 n=1 Tax=Anopheles gambiae TaxID=7165 RepID=UPI002AC932B4|nr:insulin receptor substrate 1 isoform X6 [Anopheles gambiae]
MSTLTNNANNSSSNSNSNNNNNSSSNNTNNNNNSIASYYQQYIQHYQLSPQGGTAPPSAGGSPTVTSINNNNNNNNGPTSDNIHTINNNNNNISTSSSSTSSNQSQPTTAANSGSGGGGGVVGGILGVREVSAKLFLPFARAKMMHSSSSAASTPAKDQHQPGTPLDGTSMAGMNATPSGTPSATPGTTTGGSSAGVSGAGRASSLIIPKALNVVLHGYHRKHKTNKKKYFVVYGDVPGKAARLEYFDSEKKFKQSFQKGSAGCDGGTQPKRTIVLRTCFNINKRHDLKKQIISLYTKDDSFCIVFESEEELNLWLRTLLRLQRGEDSEGDPPRPTFEHVWEVYVQRKGLGDSYGILGNYRLCITDKTLSLVRIGSELTPHQEKRAENVEFLLASVRRCGHSQRYFYLEVGRSSKTGAGEIWMEVQDSIIAQNMYTTIMKSAKSKDDNLGPMIRIRSSSANAASKPTSMLFRRQTHTGQKPINCSPSSGVAIARERCDSLPSRNRTTSETMPHQQQQQQQHLLNQQQQQQHHHQLMLNSGSMPPPRMIPSSNRPHSVHISHSHSPPVNSSPLSPPPPATYSTGSDGSSLSIDESTDSFITGSLTPDEGQGYPKVINQLNSGCSIPEENSEEFIKDYGHIDLSAAGCGISQHDDFAVPTHHTAAPTSNATPILAGSSSSSAVGRVGHPHHNSLSLPISQAARRGGSPAPPSTVGSVEGSAYMEMCSPSGSSPGDPSGSCYMAMSPVADFSRGLCSSSSAHSRASSLAEDIVDGYVPMSMPRTAAAAPAAPPTEEYMLMDPTLNGGGTSSRLSNATAASNNAGSSIIGGGGMSSAASSCSITSGTPSADLRLSLEKVPAYIGQSDEHEVNDRPFRTYSVGSRPELIKRKLRVEMLSSGESSVGGSSAGGSASSRQRAFSVGSRAKVPRCSDVYKGYSAAPVIVSFASTSSQGSMLESSNNNSSSSTSSISHAGSYGASIGDTLPMDELAGGGSAGGSSMGRKSGSGSLLPDGAGGGKPPSHGGSHGRMSDLMEIDYSSPRQQPARPSTRSSEPSGMEDYLDMSGNNNEEEQRARGQGATSSGYVEMRPGRLNSQSEENDYLNMTPGGGGRDEPDCCPAAASIATSSPIQIQHHAKQPADGAGSAHSSSSNNNNNNYLEMYPRAAVAQKEQKRTASAASTTTTATKVPSEDYLNMAPLMISSLGEASGSEEEKMHGPDEEPLLESSSAPPDGYMEMSWNHHGPVTAAGPVSSSASSSATSSARTVPTNGGDDYMNMSCGSGSQSEDASRTYSAPITIQPGAGKCRLDLSGESKVEAGANIPNYLPLGQHPDARKSVHHPHHQSAMIVALQQHLPLAAQAPIQTTTGQQSGSIGFSPSKPAETTPERARCDSRDSGIVTPSGSQPTIFPFSPASPTKPFAPAQDEPMGGESLDDLSQNYAELSLGRQQQQQLQQAQTELSPAIRKLSTGSNRGSGSFSKLQLVANQPDYVNYCPATPPISGDVAPPASIMPLNVLPSAQSRTRSSIDDDGAGDYALMNPASSRKLSTTSMGSMGGASLSPAGVVPPGSSAVGSITPPVLVARKSTLLLSSPQMGFKPIASSQDAELLLQSKAVPHATANSPKALNLGRRTGEPAFSFTEQQHQQQQMAPLQRSISTGTRPNSVNSELIGRPIGTPAGPSTPGAASHSSTTAAGSTRPSSANSERLPVISATSSSASSTSTLCESKNQSPSASSTALAMVVGSSTTTSPPSVPGSRPDSVSSITDPHIVSRPPSVSSERELHYASLDLPPCSSSSSGKQTVAASPFAPGTMMLLAAAAAATTPAATSSAAAPVTKMDVDEPLPGSNEARTSIDSSSPSPTTAAGLQQQQQPVRCAAFTYAQIDFVRSQAQSQQGQTGTGPAGASGQSTTTTTTSTPPQSSQA